MNAMIRRICLCAVVVAPLLLTACERTQFAEAPADSTGCNRALVGEWLNEADENSEMGEVIAHVDGKCQLRFTQDDKEPPLLSPPTSLYSARVGDLQLLWISAAWADATFEIEADAITPTADSDAHDVYLFTWQLDGDQLQLTAPDHQALAHAGIDKRAKAEVLRREYELHVRVRETMTGVQALLASGMVFGGPDIKSLRFVRKNSSNP